MKRSVLWGLVIGALVTGLVLWLHVSGLMLRVEMPLSSVFSPANANRVVSEKGSVDKAVDELIARIKEVAG